VKKHLFIHEATVASASCSGQNSAAQCITNELKYSYISGNSLKKDKYLYQCYDRKTNIK